MAENVLRQPKFAAAYKVASDIMRWGMEIRNPARYGSKVTVEHKQTLDPKKMVQEIAQLEKELGLLEMDPKTIDAEVVEVKE
jgi:hypothetical protein